MIMRVSLYLCFVFHHKFHHKLCNTKYNKAIQFVYLWVVFFLEICFQSEIIQRNFVGQPPLTSLLFPQNTHKSFTIRSQTKNKLCSKKRCGRKTDLWNPSENSYHRLEPALLPSPSQELASSCLSIHHRILVHTIDSGGSWSFRWTLIDTHNNSME